jgi:hypothetical protein
MREPWSFEDGPVVARRIRNEYAQWLLDSTPHLPEEAKCDRALEEGYRVLTGLMVEAAREQHEAEAAHEGTPQGLKLVRRARALKTVWSVLHLHLVALELRRIEMSPSASERQSVLIADWTIEQLAVDVGVRICPKPKTP